MKDNFYYSILETARSAKKFVFMIAITLTLLYALSGIYSISQNEIGVHLRFGKIINDRVMPGIHFSLPQPIDKVYKLPVKKVKLIMINDFCSDNLDNDDFYNLTGLSSYCITGDNNIVNISCGLQYSISGPAKYLFNVRCSEIILHEVASRTIIYCLSTFPVDMVLTYGKRDIENFVKKHVQEKMDEIQTGITISFVELKKVTPPKTVQTYFNDVINAKIDNKKMISEAESYWNEYIPNVKGYANEVIQKAYAYQETVTAEAEGDTERFLDILSVYSKEKAITGKMFYLDFFKDIVMNIDKLYIISNEKGKRPAGINFFSQK